MFGILEVSINKIKLLEKTKGLASALVKSKAIAKDMNFNNFSEIADYGKNQIKSELTDFPWIANFAVYGYKIDSYKKDYPVYITVLENVEEWQ